MKTDKLIENVQKIRHLKYLLDNGYIETAESKTFCGAEIMVNKLRLQKEYNSHSSIKLKKASYHEAIEQIKEYIDEEEYKIREYLKDIYISYSLDYNEKDKTKDILIEILSICLTPVFYEQEKGIFKNRVKLKFTLDLSAKAVSEYKLLETYDVLIQKADSYAEQKNNNENIDEIIIRYLQDVFGIDDIFKKTRKKEYVMSRYLYAYYKVRLKGMKVTCIEQMDHSTVVHAIKEVRKKIKYVDYVKALTYLYNKLTGKISKT